MRMLRMLKGCVCSNSVRRSRCYSGYQLRDFQGISPRPLNQLLNHRIL